MTATEPTQHLVCTYKFKVFHLLWAGKTKAGDTRALLQLLNRSRKFWVDLDLISNIRPDDPKREKKK